MRFPNLFLPAVVLLLSASALLPAQSNSFVEAWFLYEQGKTKLDDPDGRELGEALLYFQEAIDKRGVNFPEAEIAIGDIYYREKAYALAEHQYKKALKMPGMQIPEEKYTVLYRLAELHEEQGNYWDMDMYLQQILADQPYFSGDEYQSFRDAFLSTYKDKGLEYLFRLYRMEGVGFSVKAHAKFGWFYYRSQRSPAIQHSLFALDIMVTEAVKELRRVQPGFAFTTMEAFLNAALERENIRQYLISSEFFKTLYYLAAATYAESRPSLAEPIWRLLATYPLEAADSAAVEYADKAARQLESPWLEPYINPSARKTEHPLQ